MCLKMGITPTSMIESFKEGPVLKGNLEKVMQCLPLSRPLCRASLQPCALAQGNSLKTFVFELGYRLSLGLIAWVRDLPHIHLLHGVFS